MKSILIDGFYGADNLGDDYILYSIVNTISNTKPDSVIVKCNANYKGYEWLYKEYKNIRFNQSEIGHTPGIFEKIGFWIIGGGGLFPQENTIVLLKKLLLIWLARICGTRVIIYGVEINPVSKFRNKILWDLIRRSVDRVMLRNESSKNNFLIKEKVESYSDVIFSLVTSDERTPDEGFYSKKLGNEYNVWAVAMPWSEKELETPHFDNRYKKLLHQFTKEINRAGKPVAFIPFMKNRDSKMISDMIKNINVPWEIYGDDYSVSRKRLIFEKAEICYCMRFHSLLFALYFGTDFKCISYSPKSSELLKELDLYDHCQEIGIRKSDFFKEEFDLDDTKLDIFFESNCNSKAIIKASEVLKQKSKMGSNILEKWIGEFK